MWLRFFFFLVTCFTGDLKEKKYCPIVELENMKIIVI